MAKVRKSENERSGVRRSVEKVTCVDVLHGQLHPLVEGSRIRSRLECKALNVYIIILPSVKSDMRNKVKKTFLDIAKGLVSFTQLVIVREVTWFWHFRASDFHETFTRSSLALNMSRKLLLDPYLAIHGKIMAKNGHFFMEF